MEEQKAEAKDTPIGELITGVPSNDARVHHLSVDQKSSIFLYYGRYGTNVPSNKDVSSSSTLEHDSKSNRPV